MPVIQSDDGCPIHVEIEGPDEAPVLMLSNSLGTNLHMWDPQMKALTRHFRVLRYDRRGHGQSGLTPGPYSMTQLGRDALAVMDEMELAQVHWCGLSMGGMEGQWLGAHAPGRLGRLIMSNTSCHYPDKTMWHARLKAVRERGIAGIADGVIANWFTKEFRERDPAAVERIRTMLLATSVDGYIACGEAVRDMDHRDLLGSIGVPTLVIAGRHDPATTLDAAIYLQSHIPGASLTVIDAAHIANVEQPHDYTEAVLGFLLQR